MNNPLNILLLATRDVDGRVSGKTVVLRTIIDSVRSRNNNLKVTVFTKSNSYSNPDKSVMNLKLPGLVRITWNILFHFSRGVLSLNECLYYTPKNIYEIKKIVVDSKIDIIIADMIRTAPYAMKMKLPWILYLEDLLSNRYTEMIENKIPSEMILGYYLEYVPKMLRGVSKVVTSYLLSKEINILSKREVYCAKKADAVSLVSGVESKYLAELTGRNVDWTPMAIRNTSNIYKVQDRPKTIVFMGGLDYQHNLEAVRYFANNIADHIHIAGSSDIKLSVIGHCPDKIREELKDKRVEIIGYVEDPYRELQRYKIFLAPIISGSGIKTKILEAMSYGMPVITSVKGISGLNVINGEHCCIADSPEDYARLIGHLCSNPEIAEKIGSKGREYVVKNFSPDVVANRWNEIIYSLLRKTNN
jgi:glycosyltransferase involved in cell wall biosynthesis